MAIEAIHSFLVTPSKHAETPPDISGTEVALNGKLYDMLAVLYENSVSECQTEIAFNHTNGAQQNDARDILLTHLQSRTLDTGNVIAKRLQGVTDRRAGLGLLFLIAGKNASNHKLVVSRFPADEGILAEQKKSGLSIEFIEHVFLKSAVSYKAAVYTGSNLKAGFWDGRCVDKQVNGNIVSISDYWIKQFLASDFKTTAAQGTRRVAIAYKNAMNKTQDLKAKEEIAAAARLTRGLHGKSVSAKSLAKRFSLSAQAEEAFKKEFPQQLYNEQFVVESTEYSKHVAFQSIELSNGGILTAEAPKFDEVFKREELVGMTRFITEGTIVGERLRTTKL